jgi:hypothetical protein
MQVLRRTEAGVVPDRGQKPAFGENQSNMIKALLSASP